MKRPKSAKKDTDLAWKKRKSLFKSHKLIHEMLLRLTEEQFKCFKRVKSVGLITVHLNQVSHIWKTSFLKSEIRDLPGVKVFGHGLWYVHGLSVS